MFDTPVSIIFFNRPEKLRELYKVICIIKPSELFLIQDGPRDERDICKIEECRRIFENVNWECEIHKNYSDKNMGCGLRPATGLNWVFSIVDKSIILEDDCIPTLSFFKFCDELLTKYENEERVFLISGMNLVSHFNTDESFFFSKACTIGAWATWRRVWMQYDFSIADFDDRDIRVILKNNLKNKKMKMAKFSAWDVTRKKYEHKEKIDWWDYQFHFQMLKKNGVGIVPKYNLVKNIGFGADATNVSNIDAAHFRLSVKELEFPLVYPNEIKNNNEYDTIVFNNQFSNVSKIRIWLGYVKRYLKYKFR